MEGVEEARNENTDGLSSQPPDSGQPSYPQAGLATYTQGSAVPNGHGAEQVGLRGVQQVIENRPEVQNETHVGLADDRGHLSISNVPGGVQVAVVPSTDDVGVVDGSLASAATAVERADDGTHSHTVVTAMPPDYGLPGPLPPQYVIQHDDHEGKRNIWLFAFLFYLGNYFGDMLVNVVKSLENSAIVVDYIASFFHRMCLFLEPGRRPKIMLEVKSQLTLFHFGILY